MMTHNLYDAEVGYEVANKLHDALNKYVVWLALMGSLGRGESKVADLDILVEPIPGCILPIRSVLLDAGQWVKGGERQMTISDTFNSPLRLDLFLQHPPAQWGILTAVRLNPVPLVIYGKKVIDDLGYIRKNATIHTSIGDEIPVPEERDWFNLVGIPYCSPEGRWELTRELRLI